MSQKRPRIKVPLDSIDIILELCSVALIILMWSYCIINYKALPDTIATHFNSLGEPDGFGNKNTIWIIPLIATVLYIGFFILSKFPHIHNYMVNITEENALKNYRFSSRVLRIVNFLCIILMSYITYMIVESAFSTKLKMGSWFIPLIVGTSILLPITLIIYMKKMNK